MRAHPAHPPGPAPDRRAYALAVPEPQRAGHRIAVAFDWGLNTLLTGGTLHLTDEVQPRVVTDGRPVSFRAAGVLAKADRLRLHGEHITARIDRLRTLITSRQERGMPPNLWLTAKLTVLQTERDRVAKRRTRLNATLARAAARFMVDHGSRPGPRSSTWKTSATWRRGAGAAR
ncbi:hypothetical protein [Streptomyces sp. HC307]|uniref:hypothetical protein n=1 Tax=Streptomyces flavusporus TaxID=3385496 RepID=UPI003917627E